jgi:hypothetical protein
MYDWSFKQILSLLVWNDNMLLISLSFWHYKSNKNLYVLLWVVKHTLVHYIRGWLEEFVYMVFMELNTYIMVTTIILFIYCCLYICSGTVG